MTGGYSHVLAVGASDKAGAREWPPPAQSTYESLNWAFGFLHLGAFTQIWEGRA